MDGPYRAGCLARRDPGTKLLHTARGIQDRRPGLKDHEGKLDVQDVVLPVRVSFSYLLDFSTLSSSALDAGFPLPFLILVAAQN